MAEIQTLDQVERAHVLDVLLQLHGNMKRAARALGISRPTLYKRLERWGMRAADFRPGMPGTPDTPGPRGAEVPRG
jgi:DNA-binding NtrC family response regulator